MAALFLAIPTTCDITPVTQQQYRLAYPDDAGFRGRLVDGGCRMWHGAHAMRERRQGSSQAGSPHACTTEGRGALFAFCSTFSY